MPNPIPCLATLALALALFGAVACSSDDNGDTDSVGGAESQFCSDLAALNTAMRALASLSPSSTVDDANDARDDVKEALDDVRASAKQLAEAKTNALQDAYEEFDSAIDDVEGEQTLGQAAASVMGEAAGIATAQRELAQQANCP
jgi:hypothetical protein